MQCQKEMNQVSYIIWYDMKDTINVLCYHEGEAECAVATICCLVAYFVLTKGFANKTLLHLRIPPRTGGSFGCARGCDAGGREFETPTGPTLRVFK